ncbi:MAG: protein kinase domain-containing protein [Actinomycetota bacterium]
MLEDDRVTQAPAEALPFRRVLGGRYLLEERIAVGGMASVWRAHDETLRRTVAVKLLHDHLAADEDLRERFRREAVAAAKLGHPGIVGLYDTGEHPEATYLVMAYVEGPTLRDLLAERGRLEVGEAAAVTTQVAEALSYAHARGLVHRDVKPANILLEVEGGARIADFGIAKVAESARDLTQTGTVLGTAAYVAPEQVRGEAVDGRADEYALACVLYEAVSGRRPFEAESAMTMAAQRLNEDPLPLRAVRPDVPRGLDGVVMTALARDPDDRYPDLAAFARALEPWAGAAPVIEREPAVPAPDDADDEAAPAGGLSRGFVRSERTWLAPVTALLVVAIALTAVGLAAGVLESTSVPALTATAVDEGGPAQAVPLDAEALTSFDPEDVEGFVGGDGVENDALLANLVDGDPDTAWRTERYDDPAFGNLKPGVGVVADLGSPHALATAQVTTPTEGMSFELRVADERHDDPEAWEVAARVDDAAPREELDLGGVEARYVLLYVVPDLVVEEDGTVAAVSSLELRGEPR